MRLKPLPYREVRRKLRTADFSEVSQKGSHVKFIKVTAQGTRTAVPAHREIGIGTLQSILNQAGLTLQPFERL